MQSCSVRYPTKLRRAARVLNLKADALGDRGDPDITIEYLPAFFSGIGRSAAGECRHGGIIAPISPGVKPLGLVVGGRYVSEDRGLRDEALAAGVATPEVHDLPAGLQRRGFGRDHQVGADRTTRPVPRSRPKDGHLCSFRWLKRSHAALGFERPRHKIFRKVRFFTSLSFSAQALFQVIHN
jgi:hypothetical protein